jgi:type II secretory pathway pseudopilin PulG
MKLATQNSDQWRVTRGMKKRAARAGVSCHLSRATFHVAAFTLAEVLAAMLFLAIVIPVAVEALHVSSLAGEVAARKGAAARIADRVLNESLVTTNWNGSTQSGVISEGALDFNWTLTPQNWPQDSMQMLTAKVDFLAQGKDYSVTLSTLANSPSQLTRTPGSTARTGSQP